MPEGVEGSGTLWRVAGSHMQTLPGELIWLERGKRRPTVCFNLLHECQYKSEKQKCLWLFKVTFASSLEDKD